MPTKAEVFEGIREGLHDCLTGNTFASMSEMWDSLRIQATGLINEDGNLLLDQPLRKIAPQDVSVVIWFINKNQPQLEIAEDSQQDDRRNTARELSTFMDDPLPEMVFPVPEIDQTRLVKFETVVENATGVLPWQMGEVPVGEVGSVTSAFRVTFEVAETEAHPPAALIK